MPGFRAPPSTRRQIVAKVLTTGLFLFTVFVGWQVTVWTWIIAAALVAAMIASIWIDPRLERAPFDKYNSAPDDQLDETESSRHRASPSE